MVHWKKKADGLDGTVQLYKREKPEEEDSVGRCGTSRRRRAGPEVKAS